MLKDITNPNTQYPALVLTLIHSHQLFKKKHTHTSSISLSVWTRVVCFSHTKLQSSRGTYSWVECIFCATNSLWHTWNDQLTDFYQRGSNSIRSPSTTRHINQSRSTISETCFSLSEYWEGENDQFSSRRVWRTENSIFPKHVCGFGIYGNSHSCQGQF